MEHAMPSTLITGVNRGIGLEFVRQYLANGWQVYAACRDPSSASELHRLADTGNHNLRILALDVTDPFSIKAAAAELDGQAIDLLLNNAGVMGAPGQTIGNIDYDAWVKVLDANTMGPMRVSEAFVDNVARSDRKLIVTLTSGMGSLADNTSGGSIPYRSSKAAVNMVMRSMAIDLAPRGITCCRQSWMGANRDGWAAGQNNPRRERDEAARSDRNLRADPVRQVLQLRRQGIPLVGAWTYPWTCRCRYPVYLSRPDHHQVHRPGRSHRRRHRRSRSDFVIHLGAFDLPSPPLR